MGVVVTTGVLVVVDVLVAVFGGRVDVGAMVAVIVLVEVPVGGGIIAVIVFVDVLVAVGIIGDFVLGAVGASEQSSRPHASILITAVMTTVPVAMHISPALPLQSICHGPRPFISSLSYCTVDIACSVFRYF